MSCSFGLDVFLFRAKAPEFDVVHTSTVGPAFQRERFRVQPQTGRRKHQAQNTTTTSYHLWSHLFQTRQLDEAWYQQHGGTPHPYSQDMAYNMQHMSQLPLLAREPFFPSVGSLAHRQRRSGRYYQEQGTGDSVQNPPSSCVGVYNLQPQGEYLGRDPSVTQQQQMYSLGGASRYKILLELLKIYSFSRQWLLCTAARNILTFCFCRWWSCSCCWWNCAYS